MRNDCNGAIKKSRKGVEMPIKCGQCSQNFADKPNKAECYCPCHKSLPSAVNNGTGGWKWDFRTAQMVPVKSEGEMFVADITEMAIHPWSEVRV